MPVIPQLTITGRDGHVIYDGPGEIQLTPEPLGPETLMVFPGGRGTGYIQMSSAIPHTVGREYPDLPFVLDPDPADLLRVPEPPEPSRWTLELDIPGASLGWLREMIERVQTRSPLVDQLRDLLPGRARDVRRELGYESDVVRELMEGRRQQYREEIARMYGLPLHILGNSDALLDPVPAPPSEYDELIASTWAEFPYDPHDYGRRNPEGPMRWTPPPEGEDVKPWP